MIPARALQGGGAGVLGDGGGAGGEDGDIHAAAAPLPGLVVSVVVQVEAVAALDVAAAVFDHAVAVAGDVEHGAMG